MNNSLTIQEQFTDFLENHNPQQFSNFLRSVFLSFLYHDLQGGVRTNMLEFVRALDDLFQLLDHAAFDSVQPPAQ